MRCRVAGVRGPIELLECLDLVLGDDPVSAEFATETSVVAKLHDPDSRESQAFGCFGCGACCFHVVNISNVILFYKT